MKDVLDDEAMPKWLGTLIQQVSAWPGVSTNEHPFSAVEFRLGPREIGHAHAYGVVDIPLPLAIRDALIFSGKAERHQWLPNSGWTTVRAEEGSLDNALQLLRLSYLRIQSKSKDPLKANQASVEQAASELTPNNP